MESGRNTSDVQQIFVGEFVHSIDSQRRIAIPREWRSKEGTSCFYMLPGRHNTIQMMTYQSFMELVNKLRKVSIADPKASIAIGKLGASARECKCDKQGRVAIHEKLLDYAGIKKEKNSSSEIVLVGAFNNIQIWSKENWDNQQMSDGEILDVLQKIEEQPDDLKSILKGGS